MFLETESHLFMRLCVLTFILFRMGMVTLLLNRYSIIAYIKELLEAANRAFVVQRFNLETYGPNPFLRVSTSLLNHFIFNFLEHVNKSPFYNFLNEKPLKFFEFFSSPTEYD